MDTNVVVPPVDPAPHSDSVPPTTFPPVQPVETPKTHKSTLLMPLLLVLFALIGGLSFLYIQSKTVSNPAELAAVPTPVSFFLTILSPRGTATAVDGEVAVTGKTLPNTTVMLYSDTDETSLESSVTGAFEGTVLVGDTGGTLTVSAFRDTGEEKTETFVLAGTKRISYVGPDVLGKTVMAPGQVQKATNTQTTTIINTASRTPNIKIIKPMPTIQLPKNATASAKADIMKINTFLVTTTEQPKPTKLGYGTLKQVLSQEATVSSLLKNSLKLEKMTAIIATPATKLKRHAISGVITALSEGVITISHQIRQERINTVYVNGLTVISIKNIPDATFANLALGMRIAAVGEPTDEGILAKLIHVIPGKAIGVMNRFQTATAGGTTISPSPVATGTATPVPSLSPQPSATATPTVITTP